jgi:hypothetical protein
MIHERTIQEIKGWSPVCIVYCQGHLYGHEASSVLFDKKFNFIISEIPKAKQENKH